MQGINASGLLGNRTIEKKFPDSSNNEVESLKKVVAEMRNYISDQANSYSSQKKEIVELINKIAKENEETITKKLEDKINEVSKRENVEPVKQVKESEIVSKPNEQPKVIEQTVSNAQSDTSKKSKTKYYQICDSMYNNLMSSEPSLSNIKKESFYVGSDNSVYHKNGIRYNKLEPAYICKIAAKNK